MVKATATLATFALTLGTVAPAFAYAVPWDFVKPVNRQVTEQTLNRNSYDRPTRRDVRENELFNRVDDRDRNLLREMAEGSVREDSTGNRGVNLLDRARRRRSIRRFNRMPKPGRDAYRILDLRPNTRYLREVHEEESTLPPRLVQTGGSSTGYGSYGDYGYDRPTRRDVRENYFYNRVDDRDRDILGEIERSSR